MFQRSCLAAVCLAAVIAGAGVRSTAAPPAPAVAFSTYLGSLGDEGANGVAVGPDGSVYLVGETDSTTFPVVAAAQPANAGGVDLFVARISADGRSLIFATYFGGRGEDTGTAIAVDADGAAYVTGITSSLDYPTTPGAYDRTNGRFPTCAGGDCIDSFVTKLAPDGALVYSTFLGGEHDDYGAAIAVDAEGSAYVTGSTNSFGFPRVNAFEPDKKQGAEAFVTKLDAAGAGVVYSSYIGGNRGDAGFGIAVDGSGAAVVVGDTFSDDFLTRDPLQPANAGGDSPEDALDAFVARVDAGGALDFSTYLGGPGRDLARAVSIGEDGAIAVGGETASAAFPTAGAAQGALAGGLDGFVVLIAGGGDALVAATYLGGTRDDVVTGVAVGAGGRVAVAGSTRSADFPTADAIQAACASCVAPGFFADAFVAVFDAEGERLAFATFVGGTAQEDVAGIALDAEGAMVVAGRTFSTNFPTTGDVVQPACPCMPGNSESAFAVRLAVEGGQVTPPSIASVRAVKRPFRIEVAGTGFQAGAEAYVGGDATPWPVVTVSGTSLVTLGGGRGLKQRFPKRVGVQIRVVNPDGGEATTTFSR
jgi:hypothetical protein